MSCGEAEQGEDGVRLAIGIIVDGATDVDLDVGIEHRSCVNGDHEGDETEENTKVLHCDWLSGYLAVEELTLLELDSKLTVFLGSRMDELLGGVPQGDIGLGVPGLVVSGMLN